VAATSGHPTRRSPPSGRRRLQRRPSPLPSPRRAERPSFARSRLQTHHGIRAISPSPGLLETNPNLFPAEPLATFSHAPGLSQDRRSSSEFPPAGGDIKGRVSRATISFHHTIFGQATSHFVSSRPFQTSVGLPSWAAEKPRLITMNLGMVGPFTKSTLSGRSRADTPASALRLCSRFLSRQRTSFGPL